MSQARVTDFFAHRKKGGVDGGVRRKGKNSAAGGAKTKATITAEPTRSLRSAKSSIHEEFIRLIDEATAVDEGSPGPAISPPRTPKRTSTDAEFDLGAALFCSTAEHSSTKKKLRVEVGNRDKDAGPGAKAPKKTARKKLILCTPQAPVSVSHVAEAPSPQSAAIQKETKRQVHQTARSSAHSSAQVTAKQAGKQGSKTLSKEEIAALKSRLQKIKKQTEKLSKPACPANVSPAAHSSPSSSTTAPASDNSTTTTPVVVDKAQISTASDAPGVKATLSRAKELVASVQRRKEERERQESKDSETLTQEGDGLPGYQRYHTLAEPVPPGLTLPYQYKLLAEIFRSMDTIVSMLYNRSETATFAKVKQGVQDMTHKRFEESHLGKIKTVFPNAYTFRQEKNIPTFSYNIKKGSYQLTMEPVLCPDKNEARPLLSASRLLERRHIFHQNLVSIVKQHHRTFLSSSVPPLSVPDDLLTRWHPRFNVDTVPIVECSPVPQPPHTDKLSTAQEVLDKARTLMTPKMEKALANIALKTADTLGAEQIPPQTAALVSPTVTITPDVSTAATTTQTPSALKGVSQALLERIRAKEAQKLQATMTRNPVQEQRLLKMSRLPELARILRNVFVAEKKPALIMEVACNRMVASYRSALSTGEMEKHLRLLSELVPDWLAIHPIRKDLYLKLTKSMELNVVVDKLNARQKEEERL